MPGDTTSDRSDDLASGKKLRLLFVVDSTFPTLGGAESQARKLAISLRERGHDVDFVAPQVLLHQSLVDEIDGFSIRRIPYPHIKVIGGVLMLWGFARFLLKEGKQYDAIHVHITRLLAAVAAVLKPFVKRPVITKISGYFEFKDGILDESKRWLPVNFLVRRALRKVDYFQTISGQTREKLLAAGYVDEQISFVPNGIDTRAVGSTVPRAKSDDVTVFGYCGRLREIKGAHVLVDAFAQLVKNNPDRKLCLRLAGDGVEMDGLVAQSEKLGIREQVDFLGQIEDTASAYESFDYYVQPSFAEGLPNSVIEAMLARLPVVASDVGGNVDLVKPGDTGLLYSVGSYPEGNATDLAKCLQQCLDSPDQMDKLAASALQLIQDNYSFETITDQLIDLYRGRT